MSKSDAQTSQLKDALARLEEAMSAEPTAIAKDASIQRFEFTIELAWKTLKTELEDLGHKVANPKDTFRIAADENLIDDPESWLHFLRERNYTAHIYSEDMANDVYQKIKAFPPLVHDLLRKLN